MRQVIEYQNLIQKADETYAKLQPVWNARMALRHQWPDEKLDVLQQLIYALETNKEDFELRRVAYELDNQDVVTEGTYRKSHRNLWTTIVKAKEFYDEIISSELWPYKQTSGSGTSKSFDGLYELPYIPGMWKLFRNMRTIRFICFTDEHFDLLQRLFMERLGVQLVELKTRRTKST